VAVSPSKDGLIFNGRITEDLRRQIFTKRYQIVEVEFTVANTDTPIPHTLRVDYPEDIRWLDITPGTVYTGGIDTVAHIYRSSSPTRAAFTSETVFLRSTVAGYQTRILLFVER